MLSAPPPGYNTAGVNRQMAPPLTVPGQQGIEQQGYFNPYRSSFAYPSSFALPSSIPAPNPWYQQKAPANAQQMQMAEALRGTLPS